MTLRFGEFLSVEVISLDISSYLCLPLVPVVEKLLLVVEQLLVGLRAELEVGTLHNGVHGTSLLAEATVDTLGHVDVVSCGPPSSVLPLLSLDGDGLSRANGLTELARNAALLPTGVTT